MNRTDFVEKLMKPDRKPDVPMYQIHQIKQKKMI